MANQEKTIAQVKSQIAEWQSEGLKVAFTNGVFDILHVGHVTYLEAARECGDRLVLGLNSDDSVRRLGKSPERPINPEPARHKVLESLRFVDAVVVFDEDTPLELITSLKPDVLVKGGDYNPDCTVESDKAYMVGSKEVRSWGGEVKSIPIVEGFSTTNIIKKLRQ